MGLSQIGWLRLEFGPAFESSQLLAGFSVVEAKFGLLEKEGKVGFRNAVVSAERALCLVPEVLNTVDVIVAIENMPICADYLVELRGFEPLTSAVQRCLPAPARPAR